MDQPFTPHAYVRLLVRRWPLIIIPAIIAVIVAAVLSLLTAVQYTAKAVLIAPNEQLAWRWENRLSDVVDARFDWRAEVTTLLGTDEVAKRALAKVQEPLTHPMDAQQLVAAMRVHYGDGSLFDLLVTAPDPDDAALLANAVAAALPEAVADFYAGDMASNQMALDAAMVEYDRLDKVLLEFRSRTGMGIGLGGDLASGRGDELFGAQSAVKQELTIKNSTRASLNNAIDRIDMVMQTADGATPAVTLLDIPELSTYGVSYEELRRLAESDARTFTSLLGTLRGQMAADLETLTVNALALQEEESRNQQELDNILRTRGVWLESVAALERREVELQMKPIIEGSRVQIVDPATPPAQPSQPRWVFNLGVALAGGLLLGLLLAVASIYLDSGSREGVGS